MMDTEGRRPSRIVDVKAPPTRPFICGYQPYTILYPLRGYSLAQMSREQSPLMKVADLQ
jgi:hypothetical protein